MPSVRVTCPECNLSFNIPDRAVGGLVACRDCNAEFYVEMERDETADDERPLEKAPPRPRSRSRPDVDSEPVEWKSDLPVRSPLPILLGLVGVQAVVGVLLLANWFFPIGGSTPTGTKPGYYSPDAPKTAPSKTTGTRKW